MLTGGHAYSPRFIVISIYNGCSFWYNSVSLYSFVIREYGELLVRCGLIGEAVKTFEDLELWDNLILCYR